MSLIDITRWPTIDKKRETFKQLGYEPFPEQWPFHQSPKDVIQVIGGESAGKSLCPSHEVIACLLHCDLIYLIGETYTNPRKEFQYLRDCLVKLGAVRLNDVSFPKTGKCSLTTLTGCHIETLSVQEGASAVIATGEQADIYLLCEAGIIDSYLVFSACVRRATRNKGRVILSGTLKDNFGWYAALYDDLQVADNLYRGEAFEWPAWINRVIYPGGINDPEIVRLRKIAERKGTMDEFNRTIAAKRSMPPAIIFQDFSYARNVKDCPYNPDLPVTLAFDPGYSVSAYAVGAFQFPHNALGDEEVWQIDELYLHGHTHKMVIDICKERPWWPKVDRIVSDIAARQHQAAESGEEVWRYETGQYIHNQPVKVMDGINSHKSALDRLFHDPCCKHTLAEYKLYRRPTDRDGNPTSDKPLDKDNHAMKMIAYMLVDRYGFVQELRQADGVLVPRGDIIETMDRGGWR